MHINMLLTALLNATIGLFSQVKMMPIYTNDRCKTLTISSSSVGLYSSSSSSSENVISKKCGSGFVSVFDPLIGDSIHGDGNYNKQYP